MKRKCHWRVNTPETDFYGGKTKAEARKLQKKLGKGRLLKICSAKGHKSVKPASTLIQWTLIIAGGAFVWMILK